MTDSLQKFCSGVMINNAKGDGRQLLLTANHCVFTDLSNSIAGFNYERLGCGGTSAVRQPQTVHGMKLLARWSDGDFALFEVQERIPKEYNAFLAGWDASTAPASNVAGIHHPSGDVKKISRFSGQLKLGSWSEGPQRAFHWIVPAWSSGVTEPGSSGSPLFTFNGLVIGQLHGGASACDNLQGADLYGGLAFNFVGDGTKNGSLKPYLDPIGSGVKALNGRDLYPSITTTTTTMATTTTTAVSIHTITVTSTKTVSVCPSCLPRDLIERMLDETDKRLKRLETIRSING